MLSNLLIRTISVPSFLNVPLSDVLLRDSSLAEQVDSAASASAKSSEHKGSGLAAKSLLTDSKILLDLVDQLLLVQVVSATLGEGSDGGELLAGVGEVPGPGLDTQGSAFLLVRLDTRERGHDVYLTGETSMLAKGTHSSAFGCEKELEIVED